jgi:hypothetical protein
MKEQSLPIRRSDFADIGPAFASFRTPAGPEGHFESNIPLCNPRNLLYWFNRGSRTAMPHKSIIFAFLLISACQADRIACPEVATGKLKATVIRPGQLKKQDNGEKFSASTRYRPSDFRPRTDLKKAESIEEWDCPQPGKIQKMAREQKRRMEKQMRLEEKKQRELDTLTVLPVFDR